MKRLPTLVVGVLAAIWLPPSRASAGVLTAPANTTSSVLHVILVVSSIVLVLIFSVFVAAKAAKASSHDQGSADELTSTDRVAAPTRSIPGQVTHSQQPAPVRENAADSAQEIEAPATGVFSSPPPPSPWFELDPEAPTELIDVIPADESSNGSSPGPDRADLAQDEAGTQPNGADQADRAVAAQLEAAVPVQEPAVPVQEPAVGQPSPGEVAAVPAERQLAAAAAGSLMLVVAGSGAVSADRAGEADGQRVSGTAWRVALARWWLAAVISVVIAALSVAMTVLLIRRASTAASDSQGAAAAVAVRDRAAAWIAYQVSPVATVSCDPEMCDVLKAHGVPAVSLSELAPGRASPRRASLVVATPAVRSLLGSQQVSVDAPVVLASFGTGLSQISIRAVARQGAGSYLAALGTDALARETAGRELLHSQRVKEPAIARKQLASGQVDSRLLVTLAGLAAGRPVTIVSFGDLGPGASPGVPLRSADLALPRTGVAAAERPMVSFLHTQRGAYRVGHINVLSLPTGQHVLRIQFSAPSPLGLLRPLTH